MALSFDEPARLAGRGAWLAAIAGGFGVVAQPIVMFAIVQKLPPLGELAGPLILIVVGAAGWTGFGFMVRGRLRRGEGEVAVQVRALCAPLVMLAGVALALAAIAFFWFIRLENFVAVDLALLVPLLLALGTAFAGELCFVRAGRLVRRQLRGAR